PDPPSTPDDVPCAPVCPPPDCIPADRIAGRFPAATVHRPRGRTPLTAGMFPPRPLPRHPRAGAAVHLSPDRHRPVDPCGRGMCPVRRLTSCATPFVSCALL